MKWNEVIEKIDILPKITKFKFGDSNRKDWGYFAIISATHSPVFEFGTFRGAMTELLALNSPKKVYTIDIGNSTIIDKNRNSEECYDEYEAGEVFKNNKAESNIIQLIGDTTEFDFSSYYNKFGFIFIDGGHSDEVCMSDSLNAFKMLKPGGIIIWDDYSWLGVRNTIKKLQEKYNIDIIEGRYAIYIK